MCIKRLSILTPHLPRPALRAILEAPLRAALTENSMILCQYDINALPRLGSVLGYTLHAGMRSYAQCLQSYPVLAVGSNMWLGVEAEW